MEQHRRRQRVRFEHHFHEEKEILLEEKRDFVFYWSGKSRKLLPIKAITRSTCIHIRIVSSFPTQDFATAKRRPIPPSLYIASQSSSTNNEQPYRKRPVEVRRRRMRQTRSERLFVPRQWMYTSLMQDSK